MKESRLVYIASPYAGDIQSNVEFAKAACRFAVSQGATPLAVHLLYPQILDDRIPDERTAGIQMGLRVLRACDELWVCGDFISHGMQAELDAAKEWGIPVKQMLLDGITAVSQLQIVSCSRRRQPVLGI